MKSKHLPLCVFQIWVTKTSLQPFIRFGFVHLRGVKLGFKWIHLGDVFRQMCLNVILDQQLACVTGCGGSTRWWQLRNASALGHTAVLQLLWLVSQPQLLLWNPPWLLKKLNTGFWWGSLCWLLIFILAGDCLIWVCWVLGGFVAWNFASLLPHANLSLISMGSHEWEKSSSCCFATCLRLHL